MKKVVCGVYDMKAGSYDYVGHFDNLVQASRAFENSVRNPDSVYAKYPMDFYLVHLADFDVLTGFFECKSSLLPFCNASDFLTGGDSKKSS